MDLSGAFPPEWGAFGRSLRPPTPGALPLPRLLEQLRGAAGGVPRSATVSMWSQRYLLALVPPVLAAGLCTDRAPPLHLDAAAILPGADGMPDAVCLPGLDRRGPTDLTGRLLRRHLVPLADRLMEAGLPAPVLWSNAGYVIAWSLRTIGGTDAAALLARLQSPFWNGQANPLPPRVRAALAGSGRSACCLRFRLPSVARCSDCPRS